jgi:uncharacterized protein (DUF885 family)
MGSMLRPRRYLRCSTRRRSGSAASRAAALRRWQQLPHYLATQHQNLLEGLRLGITAPRHNVELAVAALEALRSPAADAERNGDALSRRGAVTLAAA